MTLTYPLTSSRTVVVEYERSVVIQIIWAMLKMTGKTKLAQETRKTFRIRWTMLEPDLNLDILESWIYSLYRKKPHEYILSMTCNPHSLVTYGFRNQLVTGPYVAYLT